MLAGRGIGTSTNARAVLRAVSRAVSRAVPRAMPRRPHDERRLGRPTGLPGEGTSAAGVVPPSADSRRFHHANVTALRPKRRQNSACVRPLRRHFASQRRQLLARSLITHLRRHLGQAEPTKTRCGSQDAYVYSATDLEQQDTLIKASGDALYETLGFSESAESGLIRGIHGKFMGRMNIHPG